jgi:hypothetical protein
MLIQAADSQGWIQDLFFALRARFSGDLQLAELAAQFGVTTVIGANTAFDDTAREMLSSMEPRVCRVDVGGLAVATGFLVGVDLILTSFAVLDPLRGGTPGLPQVRFLFDQSSSPFSLASDWQAAVQSDPSLDYALLRASYSPGAQPIRGLKSSNARGWIEIPNDPPAVELGQTLTMLEYAVQPPELQAVTAPVRSLLGGLVYYECPSPPGSAGAPCFSSNVELVAMHQGVANRMAFGVALQAILADLELQGLRHLLGTQLA